MISLKGMLFATSSIEEVQQHVMNGSKVLFIGDPTAEQDFIQRFNMIVAMPLVPDYNIMSKDIEGEFGAFDIEYDNMLSEEPAAQFFAAIITAMFKGFNVVLYFPKCCLGLRYVNNLLFYIQSQFGIIAQTKTTKYMYIESFDGFNVALMYANNTINGYEFLLYFSGQMDIYLAKKLIYELKPFAKNPNDINSYLETLTEYRNFILSTGVIKPMPIQYDYGIQL